MILFDILNLLPNDEKIVRNKNFIKIIYNYILNNADDVKKMEISYVSSLFNNKIGELSKEEALKHVEYIYNNFLKKMIYDSINRERIFDIMNECVKVFVDYYSEYQNVCINDVDGVVIKKGIYR